jgi:endonuclease-8
MPEGDAVRRTARRLDAALAGGALVRAELRVPRFATVDLRGMQVLGTHVVGKHLLTRLTGDRREWTLHHHLRMDGSWRTGPPGGPGAPGHQIRVWLATVSAQAVGVRVHDIEVRPTREEAHWVGHLGPDIMADGFDPGAAAEILVEADRPLVEALLDQRLVCGMGTIWASELASAAGVDPWAATSSVTGLGGSLATIRTRMLRAVDAAPPVTRRELRVFERTGQPCRSCGTPIRSGRVGTAPMDRPTYWCPQCQPAVR